MGKATLPEGVSKELQKIAQDSLDLTNKFIEANVELGVDSLICNFVPNKDSWLVAMNGTPMHPNICIVQKMVFDLVTVMNNNQGNPVKLVTELTRMAVETMAANNASIDEIKAYFKSVIDTIKVEEKPIPLKVVKDGANNNNDPTLH